MNQIVTIRDRRQITLPRPFLSRFGLDVGDKLLLELKTDEIKIQPIKMKTVDLLSKIQDIVKQSGISEKNLQQSGMKLRKKLANSI